MKSKILIVDDEPLTRNMMAKVLSPKYDCLVAADADAAMTAVEANRDLALLITDYKMPGLSGIELIRRAKAANGTLSAILITAFGEIELAVEAMKEGADDFLTKPITDLDQLELRVAKAIKTNALEREVADLRSRLDAKQSLEAFTGNSEAMQRVYGLIRKVAPTDATVLIEGPSGSGKELAARSIHSLSRRAQGPFVAVECSALSKDLLESELFGYEKNAFTGADQKGRIGNIESADGGTLFLDEIGEIDLATQVKLLRVLETKAIRRVGGNADIPVDFRLVAATNRNLAEMVAAGTFREDLYYRLNVIDIRMPALREHPEDIALIVNRYLREFAKANGSAVSGIDADALARLEAAAWPGNVRQLRNVIEKMVILATGPRLTLADVPREIVPADAAAPASTSAATVPPATMTTTLEEAEKAKILATLAECGNNKSKAAEMLGISRRTLHRKLNSWKGQ